uniref:Uncharacterized protein n=1 Tax=Globisporangium ultimum (strain ATCC 200006 / CBS 805.95 / DAOM BR144) TaxID=431595 RepID=K3W5V1_GLOUD
MITESLKQLLLIGITARVIIYFFFQHVRRFTLRHLFFVFKSLDSMLLVKVTDCTFWKRRNRSAIKLCLRFIM